MKRTHNFHFPLGIRFSREKTFEITEHKIWSFKKFRGRIDGEHK